MKKISHWFIDKIKRKISSILKKYEIEYDIKSYEIKRICSSIFLNQIFLSKKNILYESIKIEYVCCKLSVWKSLFNMALMGEIDLQDISCNMSVIADKLFYLKSIKITFRLRGKFKIACFDVGNISCFLQLTRKKRSKELIIDIPNFSWNDIRLLFSGNFASYFLQNLFSDDKLHLQACLEKTIHSDIPFVYANINYDALHFHNLQKHCEMNKDYLIRLLYEKLKDNQKICITYNDIPKDLVNAIICTEDPLFWSHEGISLDFISFALATNIKEKRIIRGASTITMQLIRNLFLSHDRNFLRKIEESTLALLLENYYKIDKQVILEMYINIIEFAPNIYGLYDAAFFYFEKEYTNLTLIEIITLTYIIPRPKHFYDALITQSFQLKTNLYNHIKNYSYILFRGNFISVDRFMNIGLDIHFAERFGSLNLNQFALKDQQDREQTNQNNLKNVHPNLVTIIREAAQNCPVPFIIIEGVRTAEKQKKIYAQGRTLPGAIVTYCDGVKEKSNHQLKDDGYGYAVDLYPYISGKILITESNVPEILQIIAKHIKETAQKINISITWGGDWKIRDYPHFELRLL